MTPFGLSLLEPIDAAAKIMQTNTKNMAIEPSVLLILSTREIIIASPFWPIGQDKP